VDTILNYISYVEASLLIDKAPRYDIKGKRLLELGRGWGQVFKISVPWGQFRGVRSFKLALRSNADLKDLTPQGPDFKALTPQGPET